MLGSDRFAFETPNVIDPGDLPPSAPPRRSYPDSPDKMKSSGSNSSTYSNSSAGDEDDSVDDVVSYQMDRESSARLLSDIGDLDLSPPDTDSPYDPYDDEDDEDEEYGTPHRHSSSASKRHGSSMPPNSAEARRYAENMLNMSERGGSSGEKETVPLTLQRTVQLDAPSSRHLVRKRILRVACRIAGVVLLMVLVILIFGAIIDSVQKRKGKGNAADNNDDVKSKFSWQTVRHYDMTSFLSTHGVSSHADLTTAGTPQYQASNWIADQDELQVAVPAAENNLVQEAAFVQRYVLAVVYFALQGDTWTQPVKFLSLEHECAWFQSTHVDAFIQQEYAVGVTCDPNGLLRVTSLFLPNNELKGSLPTELQHLSHLELLALPDNDLTGSIPSQLVKLQQLSYLDVAYNLLTGQVPAWLGDGLADLQVLGLSNNLLTGSIPPNVATLGRLKTLAVDDNQLTGSLDFANQLTNLEYFYADRNAFGLGGGAGGYALTGDFLARLDRLRELDLSGNQLAGSELPQHFFKHPTLHVLDLAENRLTAQFPATLADPSELDFLSLRGNQIVGTLPKTIQLLSTLEHLDLRNNSLTGKLPVDIGKLEKLTYCDVSYNDFYPATLPAEFVALTNLRELSLAGTQLTGQVPDWLGEFLPELVLLDLSYNQLRGSIPVDMVTEQFPRLDYLLLHHNQLTGVVPAEATKYKVFAVHGNNQALVGDLDCQNQAANTIENPNSAGSGIGDVVLTDCSVGCRGGCCSRCCAPTDDATECFADLLQDVLTQQEGLWEFGYHRTPFGFDPDILDESGLFAVIDQQP